MRNSTNNTGKLVGALILGAAIGAAVGILLAPDKGNKIRKKLSDGARDFAEDVTEKVKAGMNDIKQRF